MNKVRPLSSAPDITVYRSKPTPCDTNRAYRHDLPKFVPVTSGLLRGESVAHDIFGHHPRHHEIQEIIFAAGLGTSATHFESAERMPTHHCAGAGAIDINVAGYDFRFGPFDIRRTSGEE